MRQQGVVICLVLGILFCSVLASTALAANVEPSVLNALEQNSEVSVIVILKETDNGMKNGLQATAEPNQQKFRNSRVERQDQILNRLELKREQRDDLKKKNLEIETEIVTAEEQNYDFDLKHQYSIINGFSGEVTSEGLEKLAADPEVERIILTGTLYADLDESVSQINANKAWNLSVNGNNLTGKGQTVCVIDTGIDTNHSAFTGRILDQYCYCRVTNLGSGGCCPDQTIEDDSAEDDQGHGTHCAGIAAGNHSTYRGVAPEAGIVAIKVCNNAGSAACSEDDVIAGIEWCTNNATLYNISAISISLGGGGPYNSYCNSYVMTSVINNAVKQNISVVIAAGNNGYTNGISAPGCVENVTAVGAVNDADSISYNRGTILDLLAPGVSITAPYDGGGTATLSGTSMATPHVAGTVLLLRQYWQGAYSLIPTPQQLRNKLAITGKNIDDSTSSGRNYSRIDVLAAVRPYLNFTASSPLNSTTISLTYALINVTADVPLSMALLEWNYNNGTVINRTMTAADTKNYYFNITSLTAGNYSYQVYGNDSLNTFGVSEKRVLNIDATAPGITFISPTNNSFQRQEMYLSVQVTDNSLSHSSYNFSNSTHLLQSNSTIISNPTSFNWTDLINISTSIYEDKNYTLTVFANDTLGNYKVSSVNVIVDKTAPNVGTLARTPTIVYNDDTVTIRVNITDSYLNSSKIYLEANYSGSPVNYSMNYDSGNQFSYSFTGSSNLSNQKIISYRVYAFDNAGNSNVSTSSTFTVQNRVPVNVTITAPVSGAILEAGIGTTFSGTAADADSDTLSYNWSFGNGEIASGSSTTFYYNSTGSYTVQLNASDSYAVNYTTISVTVNDSRAPTIRPSYSSEVHLQRDTKLTLIVVGMDYSGIYNLSGWFDNISLPTDSSYCSDLNETAKRCSWSVTFDNSDLGWHNITVNVTDNSGYRLVNSTIYLVKFVSCSDNTQNGNEAGVDCGGSCSACSSSSSSSSGGGGGGGGGGGSGGTTIGTTGTTDTGTSTSTPTDTGTTSGTGTSEARTEVPGTVPIEPIKYSQAVSFIGKESQTITIDNSEIAVRELAIKTKENKEVTLEVTYYPQKPETITELDGTYQYLEIKSGLEKDEIKDAQVLFSVPLSWLNEHLYLKETVALNYFDGQQWQELDTEMYYENGDNLVYQAELDHFSYFAITAKTEMELSWMKGFIPPDFGTREFVFFGLIIAIIVLVLIYLAVREKKIED